MRIITHSSLEINRNCCREENMKHREMSPYGSYRYLLVGFLEVLFHYYLWLKPIIYLNFICWIRGGTYLPSDSDPNPMRIPNTAMLVPTTC